MSLFIRNFLPCLLALSMLAGCTVKPDKRINPGNNILLFSKTEGYRHESIEHGSEVLRRIGEAAGSQVIHSEDPNVFTEDSLRHFSLVIFLSTTGDILDFRQQNAFERYIQAGGSFMGIHAAADTEYDWPWYNGLVGGYFESHPNNPNVREALVKKSAQEHVATDSLPSEWLRKDEWYNYRSMDSTIIPLQYLDENSYEGGTMDNDHPITWYHDYDGGKAFYTGMGHTSSSFDEVGFQYLLKNAIAYLQADFLDYTKVRTEPVPDNDRFGKVVLASNLYEPTEMAVLPDDRVLFIERRGAIKLYVPEKDSVFQIGEMNVFTKFEYGLMGLAIDPEFEENNRIYLYYSPNIERPVNYLSRFQLIGNQFYPDTEKVILEVDVQREECCHTGGSLAFDAEGNLFLSTGDDTNPFASNGYGPMDGRTGRSAWDARKSSANTNDLRGKILRIKPLEDGTYSIPEGNLFPEGMAGTRPEIYVMGCRNPYRISVDQKTGYLYWGDVGPDAADDDSLRGPRGHDEINQARTPGFHGWPMFVGNNKAYREYDFETGQSGPYFNPDKPVNNSPNNTGIQNLPPARPAFVWYPYASSEEFPLLGSGGRNAMAGPVFYRELFNISNETFPPYLNGKLIIYDWIRDIVLLATMSADGDLIHLEPFLDNIEFSNLIDVDFSRNGVMYTLEYGAGWYTRNEDARLSRITYYAGNRPPVINLTQSTGTVGRIPLEVSLSAEGTIDPDGDPIELTWFIGRDRVGSGKYFNHSFDKPGYYFVYLEAEDNQGAKSRDYVIVKSGNELPEVDIAIAGNRSFYWPGKEISYNVLVTDAEDGNLKDGSIDAGTVLFNFDYLEQGFDLTEIARGHQVPSPSALGQQLIDAQDCKGCHKVNEKSIGPSYSSIAVRYSGRDDAMDYLSEKIIAGGGGVWGEQAMSAHPDLSREDARRIVSYIMSLDSEATHKADRLPLSGILQTNRHKEGNYNAMYVLTASYTDSGSEFGRLTGTEQIVLRSPRIRATEAKELVKAEIMNRDNREVVGNLSHGSRLSFSEIDFTGIRTVKIQLTSSPSSEINYKLHLDDPDGNSVSSEGKMRTGNVISLPITDSAGFHTWSLEILSEGSTVIPEIEWIEFIP
ncbi:ThuA domain-containing protein [Fulvivirga sedimenti]|uniref:ThuA domain-containing protein n=1 Tax=Fulvivirga sedimenti TaxID=2879465 RepID=A0A9X1HY39_9BACT|nr:ThuA domain-containing protein [Fulvivirga sedimenti]MCA6079163.1 ThuA domain-containing protein [Fulvivirga sedimenti]